MHWVSTQHSTETGFLSSDKQLSRAILRQLDIMDIGLPYLILKLETSTVRIWCLFNMTPLGTNGGTLKFLTLATLMLEILQSSPVIQIQMPCRLAIPYFKAKNEHRKNLVPFCKTSPRGTNGGTLKLLVFAVRNIMELPRYKE